jgi:GDP-L-fucose synthase
MHNLGWKHKIDLKQGIERTYEWFLENIESIKEVKLT